VSEAETIELGAASFLDVPVVSPMVKDNASNSGVSPGHEKDKLEQTMDVSDMGELFVIARKGTTDSIRDYPEMPSAHMPSR
jgi:hypothetical protein